MTSLLERILREQEWQAATSGPWARLSGGTVDFHAALVTDVLLLARAPLGTVTVRTRLPVRLPHTRREEAAALCLAINTMVSDGVLCVSSTGAPEVVSKAMLPDDERGAGGVALDTILRNRALAQALLVILVAFRSGKTVAESLADTPAATSEPMTAPPPPAARFELGSLPAPHPKSLNHLADLGLPSPEAEAIARMDAYHAQHADLPVCLGPVVTHADGTLECFACEHPLDHRHQGGGTMSCMPGRALGAGHACGRCCPTG